IKSTFLGQIHFILLYTSISLHLTGEYCTFYCTAGEELTAKLLRLDDLVRLENDVMEPKRKRSFPGNNAPLDRLSVSSMETKQGTSKKLTSQDLNVKNRISLVSV
uniref:Osteocrin n=1 Tax=Sander lucioperca TaxID=283035 RepID=A0A8C9ZYG9_SANLU